MATVVAVAVGLAAGGIAYASIPDSSGLIHACYKNSGGALRVIDPASGGCLSSETAIAWHQNGGDAYLASDLGQSISNNGTTLVSRTLPAGNYTLVAKTRVYNLGFADIIDCQLMSGTTMLDEDTLRIDGANINVDDELVGLIGTVSLPSPGNVSVVCTDLEDTNSAASQNTQLLVTQVGTLHS